MPPAVAQAAGTPLLIEEELGRYRRDRDDLLARVVQAHSDQKRHYVRRYADTVGKAMRGKFPEIWWVELFAGPGRLYVAPDREFVDGSPLDALRISKPFDGYVFSDLDPLCTDALGARVSPFGSDVHVLTGDANSPLVRDSVFGLIRPDALVILYLDPEGLELEFATIDLFARRFQRLDLLINFQVRGIVRYVTAGHVRLARAMLGTDDPGLLVGEGKGWTNVRAALSEKLDELGFAHRTTRPVRILRNRAVLYDVLVASRHPRAIELFDRANRIEPDGQRTLDLSA